MVTQLTLSENDRAELRKMTKSLSGPESRRAQVILRLAAGDSGTDVALEYDLHVETVYKFARWFRQGGVDGLRSRPRPGARRKITQEFLDHFKALAESSPRCHGYHTSVWTLCLLQECVLSQPWGMQLCIESIRICLRESRLSRQAGKAWINSPDPGYERKKQRRDLVIERFKDDPTVAVTCMDQVWWVQRPTQAYAYAPVGQSPRYPRRWEQGPARFVMYASKVLDTNQLICSKHDQTNSQETIRYLQCMVRIFQDKRAVICLWDNAPWHKSAMVKTWLRKHNQEAKRQGRCRLIMVHLPSYSPWLNPIEPHFPHWKRWVNGHTEWEFYDQFIQVIDQTLRQHHEILYSNLT